MGDIIQDQKLVPKSLESFGDYLFILYEGKSFFDIFNKQGNLEERIEVQSCELPFEICELNFIFLPRLEWSGRNIITE